MNATQKDTVLKILANIQTAHELLEQLPETFKREDAYAVIENAHEAVAALLVSR